MTLNCLQCARALSIEATHAIRYRTVFGKGAKSFSPLALAMPLRVSPELEYLQVKWAAHVPYAIAETLL